MEAKRKPYPSSLNDVEWKILEPLVPQQGGPGAGRPAKHDLRDVLNGIFYVVRGGVAWRMIPSDLPPWETCYGYFYRWHKDGVWKRLNDALRDRVRAQVGKKKPLRLRSLTRKALEQLAEEEFAALMAARELRDENAISWSTLWE